MGQRLKLGLVGCGDIARFTTLFARLNTGIELTACCDVSREQAEKFARQYGIKSVFTDYAEMLEKAGLEAVYLAVPHNLHAAMIKMAISQGKNVFAEKPVTRTFAEGVEIAQMAAQAGMKVAVNYQYRYDSGCYALARAVQAGSLGEVRYARVNIPWHREANYFNGAAWHKTIAAAGGGTLITQGSHFLDVALWACGQKAVSATGITSKKVFADVEVEDLALGIVELESGALVEICSSMAAASEQAVRIEVYGAKGTAIYSDKPFPHIRFVGVRVKQRKPPAWGLHALQRSVEGFRRWVGGGEPHLVPASEALNVLAAVEAIYRSAATGSRAAVER